MRILIDDNPATYQIISVTADYVQVNDQKLTSPFILSATELALWEGISTFELLLPHHFDFLDSLSSPPEILLLGTGATLKIPSDALLKPLFARGLGIEFMDTRSACHTFTILSSEGRKVVGCFLIT
jgi:uncharacterized protein